MIEPYILLANGKQFWFEDPDPEVIDIWTIAAALSKLCRFSGHTRRFYSVAEHSIHVSKLLPPSMALVGLLHDAAEAFLVDIPSPLKPLLPDYARLERKANEAIAAKFGLKYPWPSLVKKADLVMLATEKRDLMPGGEDWPILEGIIPDSMRLNEPSTTDPKAWEQAFLAVFFRLTRPVAA